VGFHFGLLNSCHFWGKSNFVGVRVVRLRHRWDQLARTADADQWAFAPVYCWDEVCTLRRAFWRWGRPELTEILLALVVAELGPGNYSQKKYQHYIQQLLSKVRPDPVREQQNKVMKQYE